MSVVEGGRVKRVAIRIVFIGNCLWNSRIVCTRERGIPYI